MDRAVDRTRDRKRAGEKKTAEKKAARRQKNQHSARLEASRRSAFIEESHLASLRRNPALQRKASRKALSVTASGRRSAQAAAKASAKTSARAPRPVRLLVRWLFGRHQKNSRKALVAGGSVATLALLAVVPARVGSQAISFSNCQEVVKSGAEISRGQITSLLSIPEGSRREAVRQVVDEPYCLLPAMTVDHKAVDDKAAENKASKPKESEETFLEGNLVTEREAYPLAFDPEAWVVVRYIDDEYAGYDFVFKP
ncbi:MAG: hypothetical protein AAGC93_10740 [Cyanobacteria bacterium P01_F01_bin.53]